MYNLDWQKDKESACCHRHRCRQHGMSSARQTFYTKYRHATHKCSTTITALMNSMQQTLAAQIKCNDRREQIFLYARESVQLQCKCARRCHCLPISQRWELSLRAPFWHWIRLQIHTASLQLDACVRACVRVCECVCVSVNEFVLINRLLLVDHPCHTAHSRVCPFCLCLFHGQFLFSFFVFINIIFFCLSFSLFFCFWFVRSVSVPCLDWCRFIRGTIYFCNFIYNKQHYIVGIFCVLLLLHAIGHIKWK